MAVTVDRGKCSGCGTCVDICPTEAIKVIDNFAHVTEADCADCGTCVDECPEKALLLP
ncbi:MAG: 4Fe-4S binding protein [Bacillota bacterium]|nr:4Fe-4S binding protein [Bacillota bacterium]